MLIKAFIVFFALTFLLQLSLQEDLGDLHVQSARHFRNTESNRGRHAAAGNRNRESSDLRACKVELRQEINETVAQKKTFLEQISKISLLSKGRQSSRWEYLLVEENNPPFTRDQRPTGKRSRDRYNSRKDRELYGSYVNIKSLQQCRLKLSEILELKENFTAAVIENDQLIANLTIFLTGGRKNSTSSHDGSKYRRHRHHHKGTTTRRASFRTASTTRSWRNQTTENPWNRGTTVRRWRESSSPRYPSWNRWSTEIPWYNRGSTETPWYNRGSTEIPWYNRGSTETPWYNRGSTETPWWNRGSTETPWWNRGSTETPWWNRGSTETPWWNRGSTETPWWNRGSTETPWWNRGSTETPWWNRGSTETPWWNRGRSTETPWYNTGSTETSWYNRGSTETPWWNRGSTETPWWNRGSTETPWWNRGSTETPWWNRGSTETPWWNRGRSTETPWYNTGSTETPWYNRGSTETPWWNRESTETAWWKSASTETPWNPRQTQDFTAQPTLATTQIRKLPSGSPGGFTVRRMSSTSVQLHWDPPPGIHHNGELVMYEIVCEKRSDPTVYFTKNTTETSVTMEGLEAMTDYNFQIRAYNSEGPGPWTNRLTFKIRQSLPGPLNLKVRRIGVTALEASWDPPSYSGVVGYRIYYVVLSDIDMESWLSVDINGPFSVREISGLDPHEPYAVKVRARLDDGRYSEDSRIVITPDVVNEEAVDMVKDFEATYVTHNSVTLKWKPPRKPGVVAYKIEYRGERTIRNDSSSIEETYIDEIKVKNVPRTQTMEVIIDLVPNTRYTFNITTRFLDGWGAVNHCAANTSHGDFILKEDCSDILQNRLQSLSGVYNITYGPDVNDTVELYCDMDTPPRGWTVIQRRKYADENFYRGWQDYENGFGDVRGDYWMGLKRISQLTGSKPYVLRIEFAGEAGRTIYAEYSRFVVGGVLFKYKLLSLGEYSGNAGDSLSYHLGQPFSTFDADNDAVPGGNCAELFQGAWWYKYCHKSNLNGQFGSSIVWTTLTGYNKSLKGVIMMIRPMSGGD